MTLIPEVEAALIEAIDRDQAKRAAKRVTADGARGAFWPGLRRTAGRTRHVIAVGIGVLLALAVVAVVLSAGHGSRGPIAPAVRPSSLASRQRLIAILGVLREPQTKAAAAFDQPGWPMPPNAPGSTIAPDRPLVRLATRTPWGASVFVVPLTPPSDKIERKALGETVAVWVQGIGWADFNLVAGIESEGGWGPGQAVTKRDGTKLYRTFALVPDGVTKVGLYAHAELGTTTDHRPLVSATVHNNIAVFQTAGRGPGAVLGYWYGADGRIIKRLGFNRPRLAPKPPARVTRPSRPVWCPTVFHAQTARMSQPNHRVAGSFDTRGLLGQKATKAIIEARRHGCSWRVVNDGGLLAADGRPNRIDADVIDGVVTAVGVY